MTPSDIVCLQGIRLCTLFLKFGAPDPTSLRSEDIPSNFTRGIVQLTNSDL
jgi:hypothetical protein